MASQRELATSSPEIAAKLIVVTAAVVQVRRLQQVLREGCGPENEFLAKRWRRWRDDDRIIAAL
jgi:hypothetical protein